MGKIFGEAIQSIDIHTHPGLSSPEINPDNLKPLLHSLTDSTQRWVVASLVNYWATFQLEGGKISQEEHDALQEIKYDLQNPYQQPYKIIDIED